MARKLTSYCLEGIPADIWRAAQKKAKALRPPVSMKYLLLEWLTDWVNGGKVRTPPAE